MSKQFVPLTQAHIQQTMVLVVGDIMLDRYWFGDAHRISPEAPVPVVLVQKTDERLGGAANVARNVASLGARAGLLGLVGDDEAGRCVLDLLQQAGVRAHIDIEIGATTTIKQRVLARQQQLLRMDFDHYPTSSAVAGSEQQFQSLIDDYDVIVLSDYGKGGLGQVEKKITLARARGKCVLVDPKGEDYACYRGATLITPNRAELRMVVGTWHNEEDLTTRAQNLRKALQLEALLLTRSEEGMSLYTETEVTHFPAQVREVFDVSGAGDTVIAVLGVALAAGMTLKHAVDYANRAGGVVVGKLGTATVSYHELFDDSDK
ncbi:MAG: D-glycero-beta-D-manno-heptose-7-phosphate kinase [Ottowia sp.]|nr:D-glycero-beta-D-manno-heptose-7-phosphate kinase [Ottowia sp.]